MPRNSHLNKLKHHPNDNLYTRYEDIAAEVPHYAAYLSGKKVYCPCDNPKNSQFWKYLHEHFAELELRSLTATFSTTREREREREYTATYLGGNDEDVMSFDTQPLDGDGDFLSDECLDIASRNDVVITNPPFSLMAVYINKLVDIGTLFVMIGPETLFGNRHVFGHFVDKTVKVGFNGVKEFMDASGGAKTFGNVTWLHSIPGIDNVRPLNLTVKYQEGAYDRFLNYPNVINVNKIKDIPMDYGGVMAVPITFIKYYDPSRFSIVALKSGTQKSTRLYISDKATAGATTVYSRLFINQSINQSITRTPGLLKYGEVALSTGQETFSRITVQSL